MKNNEPDKLITKFKELQADERHAMLARQTKAMLGPSVVRVFKKDTKKDVAPALLKLDLLRLERCREQGQFDQFYFSALNKVDAAVLIRNSKNRRIGKGHKWGHAAKVLSLYLRGVVLHTRYFDDKTAGRLKKWLYVPVDRVVIKALRQCDVKLPARSIKGIDSKAKFLKFQKPLTIAAEQAHAARLVFDDVWSSNRAGGEPNPNGSPIKPSIGI